MQGAKPLLVGAVFFVETHTPVAVEEGTDDADDARRIEHVQGRAAVLRSDSHGGVLLRRRRPADQERELDPAPLHLLRDVDHLVEGRRDEAGKAHDVAVLLERGVEDPVGGDHDSEIDDLVAVAPENDADDVLADVVHVSLDGGENDPRRGRGARLLRLHERLEVRDCPFHRARS